MLLGGQMHAVLWSKILTGNPRTFNVKEKHSGWTEHLPASLVKMNIFAVWRGTLPSAIYVM